LVQQWLRGLQHNRVPAYASEETMIIAVKKAEQKNSGHYVYRHILSASDLT